MQRNPYLNVSIFFRSQQGKNTLIWRCLPIMCSGNLRKELYQWSSKTDTSIPHQIHVISLALGMIYDVCL